MKIRKFAYGLLATLALGAHTAGGTAVVHAQDKQPIRIGANLELSGYGSAYGIPILDNLRLAADEINEAGGLLDGRPIEIIEYDNTSNKTEAAAIATRLAGEDISTIIGPATSDMIFASRPTAIDSLIPTMYPVGTSDELTLDESGAVLDNIFRLAFTYSFQGKAAARFATEHLSASKAVAIIDQANDYSVGLGDPFIAEFEALGGTVVAQQYYNTGDQDFMGILTALQAQDFDVIYLPGFFTEGGSIIRQARELGIMQPILSGHGLASDTLIDIAGAHNINDLYITSMFHTGSQTEGAQDYIARFTERYGEAPDTFDALSYDAAHLIFEAIEAAGTDEPEAIRLALEGIEFQGVTGNFKYDEFHSAVNAAPMLNYQNGEVVEVFEVEGN